MVRGLQIRRSFLILDLVLGGLLLYVAVRNLWLTGPPVGSLGELPGNTEVAANVVPYVPVVESRSAYDSILQSGLFGDAGRWNPNAAPTVPVEAPKPAEEPILANTQLRLLGTLALKPGAKDAAAFIENTAEQPGAKGYVVGDTVTAGVTLLEVFPRRVILLNKNDGTEKKEYLSMEEPGEGEKALAAMGSGGAGKPGGTPPIRTASAAGKKPGKGQPPAKPDASGKIQLKLSEFQKDLEDNYATLLQVRPTEKRDAKGNFVGLTAADISQYPIASKLGFQDNDVLQTINGVRIQNEQQVMEVIQQNQDARNFQIGILRNGQPQTLTYNLNQ